MVKHRPDNTMFIKAYNFLKEILQEDTKEAGRYSYKGEWTDHAVAMHLSLSDSTVKTTRQDNFGLFPESSNKTPTQGVILQRLTDQEKRIAALEQIIRSANTSYLELTDKFNTLCKNLQMNHVVQVKHLVIDTHSAGSNSSSVQN